MHNRYDKYKKTVVIISLLLILPIFNIGNTKVEAQKYCAAGTGKNGITCQSCTPGVYNICVPDTGIFHVKDEKENNNGIATTEITILVLFFILAILFIVNGININKRINKFNNKPVKNDDNHEN